MTSGREEIVQRFVDFLISKQARIITANFGFVSLRRDVAIPEGMPMSLEVKRLDWDYISGKQAGLREEYKALRG